MGNVGRFSKDPYQDTEHTNALISHLDVWNVHTYAAIKAELHLKIQL